MEIARLESLTKDKELLDSDKLKMNMSKKEKMNTLIDEYSAVHYQCQNNINKTQSIVSHINYLNQELKDQQEIFQLAEIVSGKNNKILHWKTLLNLLFRSNYCPSKSEISNNVR